MVRKHIPVKKNDREEHASLEVCNISSKVHVARDEDNPGAVSVEVRKPGGQGGTQAVKVK